VRQKEFRNQGLTSRYHSPVTFNSVDCIRLCRCGRLAGRQSGFRGISAGFAVSRKRLGDALATISGFSFALLSGLFRAGGLQPDS